jgi:hypothetical protein
MKYEDMPAKDGCKIDAKGRMELFLDVCLTFPGMQDASAAD